MPSRGDGAESKKQVEEIIRNLISITAAERRVRLLLVIGSMLTIQQLHLVIQEHIWARIANGNEYLMDIVVSQLLDAAIDSGPGSDRAECVGEIFHSISSIAIRGNLVARLRKVRSMFDVALTT
jgi:neurofibromin 1